MAKQETSAGCYPGERLMGLSLRRAGNSDIDTLGCPAPAGESPVNPRKPGGFNSAGTKRAGDTAGASYSPFPPTAPADYKGGVGTGQGKGMHGAAKNAAKRSCSGDNC
jgi:hypothetical protein